ncbi:hypothetical protein [Photorhabdus caribbeanensis]|uniref:hypothetical protein n=1 Tax=Photorhabdus caribbeanensis TaxID=1004165 RepID=UPI0030EBDF21
MKKNFVISPQVINTMEQSNEPRGIQDSSSNFIYDNSATKDLFVTLNNYLIMKSFMIMHYPRLWDDHELN